MLVFAIIVCSAIPSAAENNDPDQEAKVIAAAGASAKRDGDRLILRLADKTRAFANAPSCRDENAPPRTRCIGYELISHESSQRMFVLNVYYYEGSDTLLVDDRTGRRTQFEGPTSLSPKGRYAIEILANDYEAGSPDLQIWRRGRLKFVREWGGDPGFDAPNEPDQIAYRLVRWVSEDFVELEALLG